MKIYSMTATFGKLEHETLTFAPGLNIIEAPNEWGKSTWCAFLVAMLYGIDTRAHSTKTVLADKERYAPWSGSPMSGSISLSWDGRDITIERGTKGRVSFGQFRAYETATGLDVPELTAANCGQQLLGVEKSVFLRSGFLRLTDLPVTQDEALRRRLNALVTTGDESGTADALAGTLKGLKNRCRSNSSNGLIPQSQARKKALEAKLDELDGLNRQIAQIHNRLDALTGQIEKLENHRAALEYAAFQAQTEQANAAQRHLETVSQTVQALEKDCEALPPEEELLQSLTRLQHLREQKEALQMEMHMQPEPPAMPESPAPFRGCTPEQAVQQAEADAKKLHAYRSHKKTPSPAIALSGLGLLVIGGVLLGLKMTVPGIVLLVLGLTGLVSGLVYRNAAQKQQRELQDRIDSLLRRYHPLEPGQWVSAARRYGAELNACAQALERYRSGLSRMNRQLQSLNQQLQILTGGESSAQREQAWREALECHRRYADALREQRRAEEVAQAVPAACAQPKAPEAPDDMPFTQPETLRLLADAEHERRQLQRELGRCQGQMEALGQEDVLRRELDQVNDRLQKLEDTYAALEIAQDALAQASAQLQRRFAPRISRRAQALFGKLTASRYDRLAMGEDLSLSIGAQGEDTLHTALWRSDGTIDQLYLALRLAVAEELTPNAPLILDDALARFDDTRLARAMDILEEEAETKQVLLFTCQSREKAARTPR